MIKEYTIVEFEDKLTKAGVPFSRFKTNEGWMSCFDKNANIAIKQNIGNSIKLEISTVDKTMPDGEKITFSNIKKFVGGDAPVITEKVGDRVPVETKGFSRESMMFISYAKDLMCHKKIDAPEAIEIIENLKRAFK